MSKRRSNRIRVPIHFVWTTHERLPLIPKTGEQSLWRYIEVICRDMGCDVLAIGGIPDHVHLLVNLSNTASLSEVMKRVKGGSSRFVSEKLRKAEWFGWQAHYGANAIDPNAVQHVIEYIRCQKQHHANGTTILEWEQTFEEHEVNDADENLPIPLRPKDV